MAMMKARKAKRYAEGGAIYPDKSFTTYIPPGAGYVPGVSAEHLYFSKSPDGNSSSQSGPSPAQQAEMVQAAYSQSNTGGGSGGAGGGAASGDAAGAASSGEGAGAGGSPGDAGGSASGTGGDGGSGSGTGTGAKGGKVYGNGKGIGYPKANPIKLKKMASGGAVKAMSSRGDGCATKGKTKGRMV